MGREEKEYGKFHRVSTKHCLVFNVPVEEAEQKDLFASNNKEKAACIYCNNLFNQSESG
jgi:hypothetical protein